MIKRVGRGGGGGMKPLSDPIQKDFTAKYNHGSFLINISLYSPSTFLSINWFESETKIDVKIVQHFHQESTSK